MGTAIDPPGEFLFVVSSVLAFILPDLGRVVAGRWSFVVGKPANSPNYYGVVRSDRFDPFPFTEFAGYWFAILTSLHPLVVESKS
jgi:hypothetical protein